MSAVTRTTFGRLAALLVPLLATAGCAPSPIREAQDLQGELADTVCDACFEELGADSPAACRASIETTTDAQVECLEEVYGDYSDEVEPIVQCANDAYRDLIDCASAVTDCDPDDFTRCYIAYGADLLTCDALPSDFLEDAGGCF